MKKILGFLIFSVFLMAAPAFAQGVSYYGWSGQGQEAMITGVPVNTWQSQEAYQQVVLGVGNQQVAEIDSGLYGYMSQNIQDGGVYTSTSNDASYGAIVDASGITAGTTTSAGASSTTTGDAAGIASSSTDLFINL